MTQSEAMDGSRCNDDCKESVIGQQIVHSDEKQKHLLIQHTNDVLLRVGFPVSTDVMKRSGDRGETQLIVGGRFDFSSCW